MTALFYILLGAATIAFQTTMTDYFSVWTGTRPDAILLTTIFLGIYRGREAGLAGGFLLGLFQDVLTGSLLGANGLSKGLIGYATGGLRRNISNRNILYTGSLGLFGSVFDLVLGAALTFVFLPDESLPADFWIAGGESMALTALLAPIFVGLLGMAEARILPPPGGVPYPERI